MSGQVMYESRDDGVAVLTISRPDKLNSINLEIAEQLEAAWRRFSATPEDKVAVLTGEGARSFTAGADLADPPRKGYGYVAGVGVQVTKPIVCAVSGWCIGVGMALVQFADLCVAGESAVFYYPEPQLGITRGLMGALAARIPHKIAMEVMLLGEKVPAERMLAYGLVNRLVPDGEVLATAIAMATRIAATDGAVNEMLKYCVAQTVPRGPGEITEHLRWLGDQIAGNARGLPSPTVGN